MHFCDHAVELLRAFLRSSPKLLYAFGRSSPTLLYAFVRSSPKLWYAFFTVVPWWLQFFVSAFLLSSPGVQGQQEAAK